MPADPSDRERLAREVAEEIHNKLGHAAGFAWTEKIVRDAIKRVREPLERELASLDAKYGYLVANGREADREWADLANADRAALREEAARLKAEVDKHKPNCDEGTLCCSCQVRWDSLRAQLSEARAELEEAHERASQFGERYQDAATSLAEAQQRVLELENFAIEENHAIMTLTGIPRAGYSLQEEIRAQLEETRVDLAEVQQRAESLSGHVRRLLGDLSDAERAVEGWKFKGGMGANIAQESRGRFPSMGYMAHRRDAEAALSEESQ